MTIRFATIDEIERWDELIVDNPNNGNVFQTKEFAKIKDANYWKPLFVSYDEGHFLVLERKVSFLGKFWYVPKGPNISDITQLAKILPELRQFAKSNGAFVVKLEPELLQTTENEQELRKLKLKKSKAIQAANTVIVDLSKTLDEIVAGFSSKTRGNIRAAQKSSVTTEIVPINDENCTLFYHLMTQTIGGRSHVRSYEYFRNFWQTHAQSETGIFMFAKAAGEIISMDFIMILGKKAARKDAASARDHSVRGASALLELEAIKYLKDRGVTEYDLYGSPPSDQIKNPNHPYYGFGTFKAGFNSQITDYVGCYDLVIKPFTYKIWRKYGERIAHKIHYYLHHDLYY